MPPIAAHTLDQLRDVLARYGVTGEVHDIRTGTVNTHWRVEAGDRKYALRRYTNQRTGAAIDYEHDVLRHLQNLGWPVAVPIPARDGSATVTMAGDTYALFPFLSGRKKTRGGPYYLRATGAILARLHRDLATFPDPRPRDGVARLTDLDAWVPAPDGRRFDAVLADYAGEQPRLAGEIARWRNTNVDELDRLGYHNLPVTLVHGDFHTHNIFFQRRTLTGLLDLDFIRPDTRLADLALTIAVDCIAPSDRMRLDPGNVATLVRAYHAEAPLSDQELQCIVPAVRAYYLWICGWSVIHWSRGDRSGELGSSRTIEYRLPNLAARASAIQTALQAIP